MEKSDGHWICQRIADWNGLNRDEGVPEGEAATYDYESYQSGLYVTPAFGCVLHDPA